MRSRLVVGLGALAVVWALVPIALDALGARPVLNGFFETTAYPTRNFDGYRGGVPLASDTLAADERRAPEVFWLDTALRVSDYGVLGGRVFNAYEGPEALAKLLDGLDRSKLHVVQVRLGRPVVYAKPGFGLRNYQPGRVLDGEAGAHEIRAVGPAGARSNRSVGCESTCREASRVVRFLGA